MFSPPRLCRRPNGVLSAGLRHHQGPRPLAVFRACPIFVRLVSALILTAFVLTGSPLLAANLYWDTNGTTSDSGNSIVGVWGTDNFWNTDPTGGNAGSFQIATTSADDLFISAGTSATGVNTITISGAQSAQSLTFNNGVVSLAGTSTPSLTLGTGGLTMNSTLDGTLSLGATLTSVILAGSQSWTNNSSRALSVSSTTLITGTAGAGEVNTWSISGTGSGSSTFAGAIGNGANGGTLAVKVNTPNANVTFSAANTYTGSTTLNGGTLSISADNRLGTAPGVFTSDSLVFNGGTLETTAAVSLDVNRGITLLGAGAIIVKGGRLTINGIMSGTGALTVGGTSNSSVDYIGGGSSTYSGGTTLGVGSYTVPSLSSTGSPGSLTAGPYGTGVLTLAGGTLRSSVVGARSLSGLRGSSMAIWVSYL